MTKTKKKVQLRPWDPAEYIKTEADVVAHLEAAFEDGDPSIIADVLGAIARSQGMAKIAKKTGLGRESLYKSLSKSGNPELTTVLKVLHALGLKLTITADAA